MEELRQRSAQLRSRQWSRRTRTCHPFLLIPDGLRLQFGAAAKFPTSRLTHSDRTHKRSPTRAKNPPPRQTAVESRLCLHGRCIHISRSAQPRAALSDCSKNTQEPLSQKLATRTKRPAIVGS